MESINTHLIEVLDYNPDLFVNRLNEIKKVIEKNILLIENGKLQPGESRTIIFTGNRGVGKSWLLKQIKTKINENFKNNVKTFSFNLVDLEANEAWQTDKILNDFYTTLFPGETLKEASLNELSRLVMDKIRSELGDSIIVLLIDHVFEANWNLLEKLDDYFLGPIISQPNTLVILAGRGRVYPWQTPELSVNAHIYKLEPFDTECVERLNKKLKEAGKITIRNNNIDEISDASKGYPLAAYALARYDKVKLNEIIDLHLRIIQDKQKRETIKERLEALAVLEYFDEEQIPDMLGAYYGTKEYADWKYGQSRKVRTELFEIGLIRWEDEHSGFVICEPIKSLLKWRLQDQTPEKYVTLHKKAIKIYENIKDKAKQERQQKWESKIEYHKNKLNKISN